MSAPEGVTDCPADIIEVRRNPDGSLDEIVADNCHVHLEQMTPVSWWLGVSKQGYRQVALITANSSSDCEAISEMDDQPHASSPPGADAPASATLAHRLRGIITILTADPEGDVWRLRAEAADAIERQNDEIVRLRAEIALRTLVSMHSRPSSDQDEPR